MHCCEEVCGRICGRPHQLAAKVSQLTLARPLVGSKSLHVSLGWEDEYNFKQCWTQPEDKGMLLASEAQYLDLHLGAVAAEKS
jgi:hypothetical protein